MCKSVCTQTQTHTSSSEVRGKHSISPQLSTWIIGSESGLQPPATIDPGRLQGMLELPCHCHVRGRPNRVPSTGCTGLQPAQFFSQAFGREAAHERPLSGSFSLCLSHEQLKYITCFTSTLMCLCLCNFIKVFI